jgi:hypothetical protein
MSIFNIKHLLGGETDEMAKAKPDEVLVEEYVARFGKTGLNRELFDGTLKSLMADNRVKASDVVAIAHAYAKGRKPKSKADALTAIRKRFVELRQIETLSRNAEKARPW